MTMAKHPLQTLYRDGKLHTFNVRICETFTRYYCPEHSTGHGYLYADSCPNCKLVPAGWEAWGSNGYKQGGGPDRASLLHWLKYQAYRTHSNFHEFGPGHYWRMVFRKGGRIVYLG